MLHRSLVLPIAAAALTMAATGPALAQNADFKALMERTNASVPVPAVSVIAADALETLRAIAREKGATCIPSGVDLDTPKPATSATMAVTAIMSGQAKNVWTVYGKPKGCAAPLPTRFIVIQLPDDKVIARTVNDGESLANPSIMRDTSTSAALTAMQVVRSADASCSGDGMQMLGTKVVARSPDLGPDFYGSYFTGSWTEHWTFGLCGKRVEVPVSFRADGDGGAYSDISSTNTKIVE